MSEDDRLFERDWIQQSARRLRERFEGTFSVETIEAILADSMERLSTRARVTTFLPLLAERFTEERLRAAVKAEREHMSDKPTVLFLCVHNAGRSQMAAGWMQHLADGRVDVLSGGSNPAEQINPVAVEAMAEVGIDISRQYPKPWTGETLGASDVVVTMGCGDACPVIPGKTYLDWDLDDPAGRSLGEVRVIRDEIRRRVEELLTEIAD